MPHMLSNPFQIDVLIEGAVIAMVVIFILICFFAMGLIDFEDEE